MARLADEIPVKVLTRNFGTDVFVLLRKFENPRIVDEFDPEFDTVAAGQAISFSPDGFLLVWNGGANPYTRYTYYRELSLFRLNDSSSTSANIAGPMFWSPDGLSRKDGTYLVHARHASLSGTILQASEGDATSLTGAQSHDWSPDGRFLAYAMNATPYVRFYERTGHLALTQKTITITTPAFTCNSVAYAPNGRYLAAAFAGAPRLQLYKVSGTTYTLLATPSTLPPGNVKFMAWSPDSKYLVLTTATAGSLVMCYRRDGDTLVSITAPSAVPSPANHVAWTTDGEVLSIAGDTELFMYAHLAGTFTRMANPSGLPALEAAQTSFSPDNRYLAICYRVSPFLKVLETTGPRFPKRARLVVHNHTRVTHGS